jgi:hypothetical protein
MDASVPSAPKPAMPQVELPQQPSASLRWPPVAAILAGIVLALLVSGGGAAALWGKTGGLFSSPKSSQPSAGFAEPDLDGQGPQKQAEMLLERAVSRSNGATAQIEARLEGWQGKLKWDSQLGELTTVALNSSDQSVRASAIEVQLAAYGISKSASSVDVLMRQVKSSDHAQKVWALWALGLLGNRGVETNRVVQVLTANLRNSGTGSDEDTRRWAVEGLALVGTTSTVSPLLQALGNDSSALVRERAACSLSESGMLSHDQRMLAVPQLINYSGDAGLDAQTRAWAFQALADITQQHLPNDSAAWRTWYQNSVANGQ